MRKLREFAHRFSGLFNKQRKNRELDDEIESHLQMHIEDNLRSGMTLAEARREALIKLGGIESMKEAYRDQRGLPMLEILWQDMRYGARMLRKNPGFTAVAVLTLALGIGANTAIFSVVNAVLLRPLPYPEPGQLVQLRADWSGKPNSVIGSTTFVEVKAQSQSLARIAAYCGGDMTLTGAGSAERIVAGAVTPEFFPLLGVQPALGRNFTREEDTPNGPKAAILGHGLWQSRFGGDANVLGRTITLNQQSYTVVGILPARFQYPEPFQLWTPLALGETGAGGAGTLAKYGEGQWLLSVIARLKPGVTVEQAQTELQTIARRLQPARPDEAQPAGGPREMGPGGSRGDTVLTLVGLHEQVVGDVKGALLVLLGGVAFVLLIACANVANLLLARAAARQREMAVRAALGAGRLRVARQLLTESVLLSLAGGGFGLLLAFWGVRALGQWSGASLPSMHGIGIDAWVLAFTLGVSVITGLGFGLAPAVQAWRTDVNAALKEEGRSETGGHRKSLRHLLVVSEVALALVLLIGAGLLIKSFSRLMDVNPGFRTDGVLTFQVTLTEGKSSSQRVNFVQQIIERLNALAGVQAAAATDSLPLTDFARITPAEIEGRPPIDLRKAKPGEVKPASRPTVTYDYFNAMGIRVRKGRAFTSQDARPAAGVVIVNEAFEKHHFPGESALGQRIHLRASKGGPRWLTVVGVASNVRQRGLAQDVKLEVYNPVLDDIGETMSFVLRTSGEPAHLISDVRAVMAELEPNQPIHNVMTMEQRLANTTTSRRLNTALLGSFAALALLLAVVGIYGVMSYAVTQRRREIGVRMALGAQKSDVLGLIIHGGLRLTLWGVAVGVAGAFALTRYLSSLLYSVKPTDPWTFLSVAVALIGVAVLACWVPARRAARIDPMVALRYE
jgi:predicted permease